MNTFYTMNGLWQLKENAGKRHDYALEDKIAKVIETLKHLEYELGDVVLAYSKGYVKITRLYDDSVSYIKYKDIK